MCSPFFGASARVRDDARREARRGAAHRVGDRREQHAHLEILDEQYNGTVLRIAQLTKSIAGARSRLTAIAKSTDALRKEVRSHAAALYMGARSGTLFPELDANNAREVASRTSYTAAAAARDSTLLSNLRTATADLNSRRHDLESARQKATSESHRLANHARRDHRGQPP